MSAGIMPHELEGRDQGNASTSLELQSLPGNHQKLEERHASDPSSVGTNLNDTLISEF